MGKNIALKLAFQFLCLLLCLVLIPVSFAQPDKLTGNVTCENGTCEDSNISKPVADNEGYTLHTINSTYYSVYLTPGSSETFNVSFTNEGNKKLNVAPKVMTVPGSIYSLNKSWITISPTKVTADPGIKQNFAVEVNVPEDANSGVYYAKIIFTNDTYPQEYGTSQYVNVLDLEITVPKLEFQKAFIFDNVDPGKEYVYKIKIKNLANKDVTIDPKILDIEHVPEPAFSSDLIEISAPSVIKAGVMNLLPFLS